MTSRPPRRRRPIALAALRGFEAAARRLSFTQAAAELNLTQSSISRQVAALERQVGKKLFVRRTRALELTAVGEQLLRAVQQALATIDRTVDEIRGASGPPRVALTTYASFASLWLVPRLAAFQRAHPEIEIRIDASDRFVDIEAEGMDFALRRSLPQRAPEAAVELVAEEITPAVSRALLERSSVSLTTPADLLRLPLLEVDDGSPVSSASAWSRWFEFAGVPPPAQQPVAGKLYFTFIDQTVQAAVRGQGVVLGRQPFLADLLAAGQLIAPFPHLRLRTGYAYYLIENRERRDLPHVALFRDWILEEFARGPRRDT
ncbi:MAG TPA: LysR substrate-binding domain-containing protein [Burkholderiaceae bacterium]|jgi:DNA-binding transcriptional LysR family regulator|nr:LysR substrate-binding domain-containing protein [Burkholderiaceae bacterium]